MPGFAQSAPFILGHRTPSQLGTPVVVPFGGLQRPPPCPKLSTKSLRVDLDKLCRSVNLEPFVERVWTVCCRQFRRCLYSGLIYVQAYNNLLTGELFCSIATRVLTHDTHGKPQAALVDANIRYSLCNFCGRSVIAKSTKAQHFWAWALVFSWARGACLGSGMCADLGSSGGCAELGS